MTEDAAGTQESQEHDRLDAGADASAHLAAGPSANIGARTPRGPDEIQFEPGDEDRKPVTAMAGDPLDGIPSVPANVTGGVPESQVTDRQGAKPTEP
jgi:hypothetical protein